MNLNDERVDPPVSLLDPLMSWAEEAHWSIGGMNFESLRLQDRIEGDIKKINAEHKKSITEKENQDEIEQIEAKLAKNVKLSPSPPPPPFLIKRRRRFLVDEEEESEGERERENDKRGPARNLWDDIDEVAEECGMKEVSGYEDAATRSRSGTSDNDKVNLKGKKLKLKEESMGNGENGVRVSPTLATFD